MPMMGALAKPPRMGIAEQPKASPSIAKSSPAAMAMMRRITSLRSAISMATLSATTTMPATVKFTRIGSGNVLQIATSTCDAVSQLKAISNPTSTYSYAYDAAGRLIVIEKICKYFEVTLYQPIQRSCATNPPKKDQKSPTA